MSDSIDTTNATLSELNNNLSSLSGDLSVKTETLTSFSNSTSGAIKIRKTGKVVNLNININPTSQWNAQTRYPIGALPNEYRPKADIMEWRKFRHVDALFELTASGVIAFTPYENIPAGYWTYINITYVI